MAPSNEEHLQRLLAAARGIDRASASLNRTALLGVSEEGSLRESAYRSAEDARVCSRRGPARSEQRSRTSPAKASMVARAERMPRPPSEPPNDAAIGGACDAGAGPYCAQGGACIEGICQKYCCTDAECGGGTCTDATMLGGISIKACQG